MNLNNSTGKPKINKPDWRTTSSYYLIAAPVSHKARVAHGQSIFIVIQSYPGLLIASRPLIAFHQVIASRQVTASLPLITPLPLISSPHLSHPPPLILRNNRSSITSNLTNPDKINIFTP